MSKYFNMLYGVDVSRDDVELLQSVKKVGLIEGTNIAKAHALCDVLTDMKYKLNDYEGKNTDDVLNGLLDILIGAVVLD